MSNLAPIVALLVTTRRVSTFAAPLPIVRTNRMTIQPDTGVGDVINLPYAPLEVDHANWASKFDTITRPGQIDVLLLSKPDLPTMTCTLTVADKTTDTSSSNVAAGYSVTASSVIALLRSYAQQGTRLKVSYSTLESGLWYITTLSVKTKRRDELTDEVTNAEVDVTFTRASDTFGGITGVGPITGGVSSPPTSVPTTRTYTVKKGDTLWAISIKYYGTGEKWTTIANANGIKNPKLLQIGTVLKIP